MTTPSGREHPFFEGLGADQRARLLTCAREVTFETDRYIFREGSEAATLFLIQEGGVALEQHVPGQDVVQVERLGPGDILGLSWLVPPARWTLDARAVEPVRALALDAAGVRDRMREDPALGLALLTHVVQALYQRLMRVRLQRLDVYKTGRLP